MDITTSFFWQNILLVLLLTPYIVGIAVSTYFTNISPAFGRGKGGPPAKESAGDKRILGRLIATFGATLLAFVFSTTSVISVAWALVTLVGLPQLVLWVILVLCIIPVAWVTMWTAGRAWHVEQLLEKGEDTDQPVFDLGAYLPLPFLRRSAPTDRT